MKGFCQKSKELKEKQTVKATIQEVIRIAGQPPVSMSPEKVQALMKKNRYVTLIRDKKGDKYVSFHQDQNSLTKFIKENGLKVASLKTLST